MRLPRTLSLMSLLWACGGPSVHRPAQAAAPGHSSPLALGADGAILLAVNPDADSVAVVDTRNRLLTGEILLAGIRPAVDASGAFAPAVMPRSLAVTPDQKTLLVTGERSGRLYAVELGSSQVRASDVLCSEPAGLLLSADGAAAYVACSQDAQVIRVDTTTLTVAATAHVAEEPWALAWSSDGATLLVTHFLGAAVTPLDPVSMIARTAFGVPEVPPAGDRRLAHGKPRGLYDLAARPGADELWVLSSLLGVDTAQPALDFESTAFPALSVLGKDGALLKTLSTHAQDVPGRNGALADIVSGPRALAFTADGAFALVVDADSEDVLVVDAARKVEASLLRPLPGHQPEGILLTPDDETAFVLERNTGDVVALDVARSDGSLTLTVSGRPIPTMRVDPMPARLRLGQHLFYSANSDEYPITRNHWIACATCHMEGRSDAVTWLFAQGPRDTPTNAGGMLGTGFLFRTADRVQVQDYWRTIGIEQGGHFDPAVPAVSTLLDALSDYVNLGIPAPVPPTTDPALVTRGAAVFTRSGCGTCHSGPRYTDSGAGNPTLALSGPVLLHDVGTCVSEGSFPDVDHEDIDGNQREACLFDTPSLTGVASSPPYFHDGSAATLEDAARIMARNTGAAELSTQEMAALVEFLRSL